MDFKKYIILHEAFYNIISGLQKKKIKDLFLKRQKWRQFEEARKCLIFSTLKAKKKKKKVSFSHLKWKSLNSQK